MLVSIVVPIYNMGNSIRKCVYSLLKQSYKNIEIILVDDGSKDNTYQECLALAEEDHRIKVYHTINRGSGLARDFGIEVAKGDYIFFPDADDFLENNTIEELVKATNKGEFDLIVCGFRIFNSKGTLKKIKKYNNCNYDSHYLRNNYSKSIEAEDSLGIQGAPWNKFFNLEIIRKNLVLFPDLRRHQDECFIARYMCYSKKVRFIDSVLYNHFSNSIIEEWSKYPKNYDDIAIELFNDRKKNILLWNSNDTLTHNKIYKEFICCLVKALELTFSEKNDYHIIERYKKIKDIIYKSNIANISVPYQLGNYQKIILFTIKHNITLFTYLFLKIKVFIQKNDLLYIFKS